jgi:lysophospholipid acyltransferase (LPLAT)-like uncharacterized protein
MSVKACSLGTKFGGLAAAVYVRSWMGTLDLQAAMYDVTTNPMHPDFAGPVIGIFWHEGLLLPFYLHGRTRSAILTSRHRDAEWLSEAARHLGFTTVRGSTRRGGQRALLELLRNLADHNLGIACDGPRGPRRHMAPGPIFLSSKLGIPLVAFGVGFDRPWRMPTWDQFALPRPFSRARLVTGPRMQIPPDQTRESLEHYRRRVQAVLNRLTQEAEAWAVAGTRKTDQRCLRPAAARRWHPLRAAVPPDPRPVAGPVTTLVEASGPQRVAAA